MEEQPTHPYTAENVLADTEAFFAAERAARVHLKSMLQHAAEALLLLERLADFNPYAYVGDMCVFCFAHAGDDHKEDCLYDEVCRVVGKKPLKEPLNE